jgi:hypothetical protein
MTSLAAVRIIAATPNGVQDPTNGLAPDQLTLTGSYSSVESFPIRVVDLGGGGFQVTLQQNNGGFVRSNMTADGGGVANLFQAGRVLRILDGTGHYEFGAITGSSLNATGEIVISLKLSPPVTFKREANTTCGVEGFGVGMQANVVNTIRYEIRNVKALDLPAFRPLYAASATAPGDETRYELVRVELDNAGNEMANTLEIVAEYAVDLRFGITAATTSGTNPSLSTYSFEDANVYNLAFDVATNPTTIGPERIRAVRARLTVRSREADRTVTVPPPAGAPPGSIFRYAMGTDGGSYARARTLVADIQLPNLASVAW